MVTMPGRADSVADQIVALKRQLNFACWRVQDIVDQPVVALPRTSDMAVTTYPFWFPDGAAIPDFENVDVRTTQDLQYDKHPYVTSDLNPGVVFAGPELEFNSNIKYFYTDRSLPKKKLTGPEMLEINQIYREIASLQRQIDDLEHPEHAAERARALAAAEKGQPLTVELQEFVTTNRTPVIGGLVLVAVASFSVSKYKNRRRGKQWM
jgi:hypothetical protein